MQKAIKAALFAAITSGTFVGLTAARVLVGGHAHAAACCATAQGGK